MLTTSETSKQRYKNDLSDAEWAIIQPLIPPEKPGGRHRRVNMREAYILHQATLISSP